MTGSTAGCLAKSVQHKKKDARKINVVFLMIPPWMLREKIRKISQLRWTEIVRLYEYFSSILFIPSYL
ncbi:MAG: hypothetical protein A2381_13090 [Bdellovibrionales bacterium RIFOXYB1_FULL_37_110]|nr:MAG: hypothetical protein A2181_02415 [Bdellovibrionales bacterium RIFOXYA1_FULL_38_20]OFZ51642.1 MAG: hypothetical protein A2417_12750 [Bdellovibrionales bacterium RIFOXYC1_FULL_37_79]OFZ60469.1 MAG: hypothetical protein A2381_13090 [Bdellovibrionales bacterium RIFOXYB1_FULL_37_110]OFZ65042.1 MAG: hypothetical protein A2577_09355 [Bdellovibrionales bacterium RIFOXYD1_FULL_36_51]